MTSSRSYDFATTRRIFDVTAEEDYVLTVRRLLLPIRNSAIADKPRDTFVQHTMARLTLLKQDSSPHSDFSRFRSNRIRALVGATREIHGERWGPAT